MKNFSQYIKSDRIRRYVEYKAQQDSVTYSEAASRSLSRMWHVFSQMEGKMVAILTAFRGERTLSQNRIKNQGLESDLRSFGWGYTPVLGGFEEKVRSDNGDETGETRKVDSEESYVVIADFSHDVTANIVSLLKKYGQEAAIIKYPGEEIAKLVDSNGIESNLGRWTPDQMAQYYTKMRKGPANRQFAFEAAGDSSRTTQMAVDKLLG